MSRALLSKPILLLLAVTLVIGLFVYRDYGLTWDEPLFYKYADALGYAYTPSNWLSGHFDLAQSYGPSADDHKNRGPAYLLLAREPVYLLRALGVDEPSAWHLLNFLCFLLGVYFVYRLAERLASPWPAAAAAALLASQPLLWGHGFINPKDIPFLAFFTGSVWLGFRMVDGWLDAPNVGTSRRLAGILLPAIVLGIATSNRVLGPLAGLIVLVYLLAQSTRPRWLVWMAAYALLAAGVMYATWPYLWEGPTRILDALRFMSANPTVLPVLFDGTVYRAYDLPRRYLPFFLAATLTEVVWPLAVFGTLLTLRALRRGGWFMAGLGSDLRTREAALVRRRLVQVGLLVAWLALPLLYVVLRRPPMYDGMRHFLFIVPPAFILTAPAFDWLIARVRRPALAALVVAVLLAPGAWGILRLHPYEYAYYNAFVGGTPGAFRRYETDYWLTCYREAMLELDARALQPVRVYVHREAEVAAPYAIPGITVLDERGARAKMVSGDVLLINTRTNEDRQDFPDAPTDLTVGRDGATFCIVRSIP